MFDSTSRYKDKIQSCSDAPMNAYRQDPWAMQAHRAYHTKTRDTVETSQQRLERNFMERFKNGDFSIRSGKMLLLAQLSKGIVVILFLPPFFVFVLAPKWAVKTVLPVLSKALEIAGESGSRIFARVSAWNADVFAFIQHRLLSKFKRKSKTVAKVNRSRKIVSENTYKKLKFLMHQFQELQKRCLTFIKRVQETFQELRCKVVSFAKMQLQRLKKFAASTASKSIERFREQAKSIGVAIAVRAQALDRYLSQVIAYVARPVFKAITVVIQPISTAIFFVSRAAISYVNGSVVAPFQSALKYVQKTYKVIESSFKSFFNAIVSRIPSLPSLPSLPSFPALNLAWLTARFSQMQNALLVRSNQLIEKARKASSIIAQILTRAAKDCLAKGKSLLLKSKGVAVLVKGLLLEMLELSKRAPGFLWRLLKELLRVFMKAFKRMFYLMRVSYALTKVLLRYFWQELDKSLRMTQ